MDCHQVQAYSQCSLSNKTGHDVDIQNTATGLQDTVHHFEMKPSRGKLIANNCIVLYCIVFTCADRPIYNKIQFYCI